MTVPRFRLAVIDDHPLMRQGIELTLKREKDFQVVATGSSSQDAISIVRAHGPELVLLDISIPGCGLRTARKISEIAPSARIVFLTVSERHEDVTAALEVGAKGYVLKGISGPDLVRTIRSIAAGETYITPAFAAKLLTRSSAPMPVAGANPSPTSLPNEQLSVREEQILREVSLGLTNKEIARKLGLSEKTVKHYMSGVLHKLSARNRVEAIIASRRGADRQ